MFQKVCLKIMCFEASMKLDKYHWRKENNNNKKSIHEPHTRIDGR